MARDRHSRAASPMIETRVPSAARSAMITVKLPHAAKSALKMAINFLPVAYSEMKNASELKAAAGRKKIFYLMGLNERHKNLGDQAQGVAIRKWFSKHLDDHLIFEYRCYENHDHLRVIEQFIEPGDVIFLHSGGNFGDTWPRTELIRQDIIGRFGKNPIIQLPQTIDFSPTPDGRALLQNAQRVVMAHPRILIMARDLRSAELAREYFPGKPVFAYPDMVLSLADDYATRYERPPVGRKSRLLMIMRKDREGIFDSSQIQMLRSLFAGQIVEISDTDLPGRYGRQDVRSILDRYLDFMARFDHILTDRYHGVIFSVLTNRPCVVLPTTNHKLTSAASWFEDMTTVHFASSIDDVSRAARIVVDARPAMESPWNERVFDPMAATVRSLLNGDCSTWAA